MKDNIKDKILRTRPISALFSAPNLLIVRKTNTCPSAPVRPRIRSCQPPYGVSESLQRNTGNGEFAAQNREWRVSGASK